MDDAIREVQREAEIEEEAEERRRQQQERAQATDESTPGWAPVGNNEAGPADGSRRSGFRQ
jgi:hypothetical protein